MRRIVRSATSGLVVLRLAGCVPVHISASVPALAINARSTNVFGIDLLCPNFYAAPETFVAVVTRSLERDALHYDWKRIQIIPLTSTRAACRSEHRYIGYPYVVFAPNLLRPSPKVAKGRQLFVRIDNENVLYRISHFGGPIRVETTSLEVARKDFPRELDGPEPPVAYTPAWLERLRLTDEYYRSLKWQRADRIAISDVEADSDGAVLSIGMSIGMTANQPLERPGAIAPSDTGAASAGRSAPSR